MERQQCRNDREFGPAVVGCRGDFDFTVAFELSILSILPSCLFLLSTSWRLVQLYNRPSLDHGSQQGTNVCFLIFVKFAVFVIAVAVKSTIPRNLAIASTVLDLMTAVWMGPLSWFEHRRSQRPSIWFCSYLALTILFEAAQCRTWWLLALYHDFNMKAAAISLTVSLFLKTSLLALESQRKPSTLRSTGDSKSSTPEEESGIFSLSLFWWLNSLLRLGSRQTLTLEDLYRLPSGLTSAYRHARANQLILGNPKAAPISKSLGKAAALSLVFRGLGPHAFVPILPRLALSGFTLAQSLLVRRILDYLSDQKQQTNFNTEYGLIGATFLVYSGIALSTSVFGYLHERALTQLRGYLIQSVYLHATKMPPKAEGDQKKVITLVTADVEGIYNGLRNAHELWVVPFQTALAAWLAYREVGLASLGAIGLILVSCLGVGLLSPKVVSRQQKWMKFMQSRISKTTDVLSSIKGLRMAGLAPAAVPLIQKERDEELRRGGYFRLMIALSATVSLCPAVLAPIIVFASGPRLLDATKAFTTLSYLNIMTQPLGVFIQVVPIVLASLASLQRIEGFLSSPTHTDYRLLGPLRDGQAYVDEKGAKRAMKAVQIRDASFRWSPDSAPVLSGINLEVSMPCFAAVTGPVGSGKTTLLQAIIGEVAAVDGTVAVNTHRIAYCAQVPYLPRETIRANVVGDTPFNPERYEHVLAATLLVTDLQQLPLGDATKLDGRGDVLSGGQKQRIALARALYQPADLVIADDVLSGLDKETESVVFHRVFGPHGLLRHRGAAVLLCTNSALHAEMAEMHIVLEADQSAGSKITVLHHQQPEGDTPVDHSSCEETSIFDKTATDGSSLNEGSEGLVPDPENEKSAASTFVSPKFDAALDGTKHKQAQTTSDSSIWIHYFSQIGLPYSVMFAISALAFGVTTTYPTVWLEKWTSSNSTLGPPHSFAWYMGIYATLAGCCLLFSFVMGIVVLVAFVRNSGAALHKQTLQTVMSAASRFLDKTSSGTLLTHFSQDLSIIDGMLAGSLINLTSAIVITLGQAVLLIVSSAWLAISYPGLAAVFYLVRRMYVPTALRLRMLDLEAKGPIVTHILSTLSGLATIRAFGWTDDEIKRNYSLLDTSQQPSYLLGITQQWLLLVINLVMVVLAVTLVCLATLLHLGSGAIGVGLVALISFGRNVADGIRAYTMLEIALGAIGRLKKFGEDAPLETQPQIPFSLDNAWPRNGAVEISAVSARYGTSSDSQLALNNLSMSISPGEKVAICGRTGSGKSSIIMLLLGLLDPIPDCTERVTIDNVYINRISRDDLRQHLIAMPQDPVFLQNGTSIRQNLDPTGKASDSICHDALQAVNLFHSLPSLNTDLDLTTLSQGQRQLFCLARCVARERLRATQGGVNGNDGGLVLLDEVSAHLDNETADMVDEVIRKEFKNHTVLAVTHRMRNIKQFSRAIVMDSGQVVEDGTVAELLMRADSRLRNLFEMDHQ
ncbi:Canalicular multispecific organic anion transporter 2-like protein 1 [Colletotrichum chlorophyti]|uniref:Canalicular multispecific organic anion transporter 2-like protein 1 n=1 Tax=Colletotrichum chlorophyti TaxID=708187 RepID=A0A1Q8RSK6_9PEZI|nr:Canalicular multispecific organic anion transporter 2-like protein 1 [Colletotrichum chlorophyti]